MRVPVSAIGEYIHYYTNHYIWRGIQHRGTTTYSPVSKASDAIRVFADQRQHLRDLYHLNQGQEILSNQEIDELRNLLQRLKAPLDSDDRMFRAAFNDIVREDWNITTQILNQWVNSNTLSARNLVNATQQRFSGQSYSGTGGVRNININAFRRKIQQAFDALQTAQLANVTEVRRELTRISDAFEDLVSTYQQRNPIASTLTLPINVFNSVRDNRGRNLRQQFNRAIRIAAINQKQIGDIFEMLVAAIPTLIRSQRGGALEAALTGVSQSKKYRRIKTSMDEQIRLNHIGNIPTQILFERDHFAPGLELDAFLPSTYTRKMDGNIIASMSTNSQDKVDVRFQWGDDDRTLNISAKNYNLHRSQDIGLVTDTSLLTLLYYQNNPEMVNHYLNIVSATNISSYNDDDETPAGSSRLDEAILPAYIIQAAHTIMREIILLTALAGFRERKVNLFILNDNSSTNGQIYIYNLNDMFTRLSSDYRFVIIQPHTFSNGTFHLPQRWQGPLYSSPSGAAQRISGILAAAHQTKITVQLSKQFFLP